MSAFLAGMAAMVMSVTLALGFGGLLAFLTDFPEGNTRRLIRLASMLFYFVAFNYLAGMWGVR